MADFMIYWQDHWMDSMTPIELEERIQENPDFLRKYQARYQRGDFVGVFESGRVADTQHGGSFVIVKMPNISLMSGIEQVGHLVIPDGLDENNEPKTKLVKRSELALNPDFLEPLVNAFGRAFELSTHDFLNNIIIKTE